MLSREVLDFLSRLSQNNNREWFTEHKPEFLENEGFARSLFNEVNASLNSIDSIEKMQVFRIYRDVRFSKDKSPYKKFLSSWYTRTKPYLRGSYYLHIEPGNSFAEGGFWEPSVADLLRIRKEIELDDSELRAIISAVEFKKYFVGLTGEELKTVPRGFDKNHPAVALLRKKQFLMVRRFTDDVVTSSSSFIDEVIKSYTAMRPFLDYMSDVLTTNNNGESTIK